ncbi:MAG: M48 family metallopeptidase [Muribaculaceae bacterium]|nr:M48 family metallopeptidase [Muribaculaceae bacterium]
MDISGVCFADLVKEKRKSLSVRVFPDLRVVIKTPIQSTDEEIAKFVQKRRLWIKKQLEYFKQFGNCNKICNVSGCSIVYLGRQYKLIIKKNLRKQVKIEKNKIVLCTPLPNKIAENQNILDEWMLGRATDIFYERLVVMCTLFDMPIIPILKIRKLSKRWGSYLKSHTVVLNPYLIQASRQAIDFIIAHELCHYYYKEHNADFYNLLNSKIPNWKQIEEKMELKLLGVN